MCLLPTLQSAVMEEFVSESITPHAGTFQSSSMAAGMPGLPAGFDWRGESHRIVAELGSWKQSAPEGGRADGERYLRRHYFRLRMSDETVWTVYFIRQTPRSGSPKNRWYLYAVERA